MVTFSRMSQNIGERTAVGMMMKHIVDRDQWHLGIARQRREPLQPRVVAPVIEHGGGKPYAAGCGFM
jgi:hypothetical protein